MIFAPKAWLALCCAMMMAPVGAAPPASKAATIKADDGVLLARLQAIAGKVAGGGKPQCTTHYLDGNSGPCLPIITISKGSRVNATNHGPRIAFTRGAVTRLTTDELALLTGHEIAHYYLGHTGSTRPRELEADRLGAELACKAGYSPAAGVTLFRLLGVGRNHPPRAERRAAVLGVACPNEAAPGG